MVAQDKISSFEDLECWKACRESRKFVSGIIRKFPDFEKYALIDGMRRASRSTTENIAEGYGRFHFKENIQFCRVSRGSVYELMDQLVTAFDESYITEEEYKKGRELLEKAKVLLNGYIRYLQKADEKRK
jgi:four helix bundle protein